MVFHCLVERPWFSVQKHFSCPLVLFVPSHIEEILSLQKYWVMIKNDSGPRMEP